jgi:hypothetical protein
LREGVWQPRCGETEGNMKQMIILLSTIILGIAISAMVLSFKDTAQGITDSAKARVESQLTFE